MSLIKKIKTLNKILEVADNTDKRLVDYEGIDTLVGALMGYYNGLFKTHTHDDRYYSKNEIEEKLKNFCPIRIGDILFTSSTENPASYYLNTTWELLPDNKFIKTGSTPLTQGGNSSIKISKANLPAEKLQVDSFKFSRGDMDITGGIKLDGSESGSSSVNGAFTKSDFWSYGRGHTEGNAPNINFQASRSWTGSTSSASPYTTNMGSGIAITINPEHITIKAWKRLT